MKFLLISILAAALVSSDAISDVLGLMRDRYTAEYPNHTCAVFRNRPKTPYPYGVPASWVWVHRVNWFIEYPYYVCISRLNHGDWIERTGDGGYDNWHYDPDGFIRTSDHRIAVV
ncbi:hypothetical protein DSO57_1033677 [Entomophthora muscae]|uniref:Uncharacterized protein n=1 Tax=Entomophthora muscae TaxID=34485 RepID=A0ACC2SP11_9FUNG|nr:hypothetical protein DSO57_1033677 [Entomophthora muscae]